MFRDSLVETVPTQHVDGIVDLVDSEVVGDSLLVQTFLLQLSGVLTTQLLPVLRGGCNICNGITTVIMMQMQSVFVFAIFYNSSR